MAFPIPITQMQVKDNQTFAATPSKTINGYALVANTARTVTFPLDSLGAAPNYVVFNATGDFYARWDGNAATVPSSDTGDGLGSELFPTQRFINGIATVSVIAPLATLLTISYYY